MFAHHTLSLFVTLALFAALALSAGLSSHARTADPPRPEVRGDPDGAPIFAGFAGPPTTASDPEIAVGPESILIVTNVGVRLMEKSSPFTEIDAADLDGEVFTPVGGGTNTAIVDPDVFSISDHNASS